MFCSIGLPSVMMPQLERWMAAQDVFTQVISVKVEATGGANSSAAGDR